MGNSPTPVDPVEPGYTTTEFWFTTVTGLATTTLGLLAVFGLPLSNDQRMAILAETGAMLPVLAAVYTLARSYRKRGQ